MEKTYKYRFSRRAIYWTLVYLVVFVLLGWLLYHLYEGGYLSAWFTSFIVALIALMSLSIPRRIVVTDEKVEVRCLLDITEIRRDEIASVRRVDPRRMKWFFPVFGGCGFFGYYGHFLDLRRFERVKLYASEWKTSWRSPTFTKTACTSRVRMPTASWRSLCPPEATARRKTTKWKSRRNSIGIRPKSRQKTPGDCVFPENDLIFATEAGTARKTKITNNALKPEEMKSTVAPFVSGYTTPQWAIPTEASPPERSSKRFPKTGFAPSAASAKTCSKRLRNNPVPPRRNGKAHPAGCALPFVTGGARTQAVSSE